MIYLRIMTMEDIKNNTPLIRLKEAHRGTFKDCECFAFAAGYDWKRDRGSMWGGNWVHPETKDCLFPT